MQIAGTGRDGARRASRGSRAAAYAGAVLVVAALLGPPLRDPPRDSYPLSTYPMFSTDRGRVSSVATAVAVDGDGTAHRLSPQLIGGTEEPMLAVQAAGRAVRAGPARSAELCGEVAARVARDPRHAGAELVEVRVEVHDAVGYFAGGDRAPRSIEVRARCEVRR